APGVVDVVLDDRPGAADGDQCAGEGIRRRAGGMPYRRAGHRRVREVVDRDSVQLGERVRVEWIEGVQVELAAHLEGEPPRMGLESATRSEERRVGKQPG